MKEWYVQIDDEQIGPYQESVLLELAQGAELHGDHLVWSEGMTSWQAAKTMSFLQPYLTATPPAQPPPQRSTTYSPPPSPASSSTPVAFNPVTMGDWVLTIFLMSLPVVNFILLIVWAADQNTNPSKRNWAKALLLWMGIIALLYFLLFLLMMLMAAAGGY